MKVIEERLTETTREMIIERGLCELKKRVESNEAA